MQRLHSGTVPDAAALRLNTDTVRQVFARASEIEQQGEQETLSVEQVEALGKELGLSPDAVRRALGEVVQPTIATPQTITPTYSRHIRQSDVVAALRPGALYALISGIIIFLLMCVDAHYRHIGYPATFTPIATTTAILTVFVAPLILSAHAGWRSRHIRTGALGGFFLGLATFIAVVGVSIPFLVDMSNSGTSGPPPGVWACMVLMIFVCGLVGTGGGAAWRWWNSLAKREER